jgi:hypothetical protein
MSYGRRQIREQHRGERLGIAGVDQPGELLHAGSAFGPDAVESGRQEEHQPVEPVGRLTEQAQERSCSH